MVRPAKFEIKEFVNGESVTLAIVGELDLIDLHDRSQAEAWKLKMVASEYEAAALVQRATGADKALPFAGTSSL